MEQPTTDAVFAGSIPAAYEAHLVPMIFQPYADDLASRLAARPPMTRVLEIAAGTGVVTRAMAAALPASTTIVATDLNQAMLDLAARIGTSRPVEWQVADAMRLPFDEASFDAVICQFGVMFFPQKPVAYAEVRRVLRPGGTFLFNAWGAIGHNEFTAVAAEAVAGLFPDDPPRFFERTPHGYHDAAAIARELLAAGFDKPVQIEHLPKRSRAESAHAAAIGLCQGTPLRSQIEARDKSRLAEATTAAQQALTARFGSGPIEGGLLAWVASVDR